MRVPRRGEEELDPRLKLITLPPVQQPPESERGLVYYSDLEQQCRLRKETHSIGEDPMIYYYWVVQWGGLGSP